MTQSGHPGEAMPDPSVVQPREAEVIGCFVAWALNSGFTLHEPDGYEDLRLRDRNGDLLIIEAKGWTGSAGTDADTMFGQLLRRMDARHPPTTRYAVVVPAEAQDKVLRVPQHIRDVLKIDVYVTHGDGTVDTVLATHSR